MSAPAKPLFSAAHLWSVLDAHHIPFRKSVADLIDQNGTQPVVWTDAFRTCPLPQSPALIDGLTGPFALSVSGHTDLARAPHEFSSTIRQSAQAQTNFAAAVRGLARHFGTGIDAGVSNTIARHWTDGFACVTASAFPPERQSHFGTNSRHEMIPGSATECSIRIRPDWWPPLTDTETHWLQTRTRLDIADPVDPNRDFDRLTRPMPAGLTPGMGPTADGAALVVICPGGRGLLVARSQLIHFCHDVMTPARGPGGARVTVTFATGPTQRRDLTLLGGAHNDPTLKPAATALAAAFDLPLHETRGSDE